MKLKTTIMAKKFDVIKELDKMIKIGFDCVSHHELQKLERRVAMLEKGIEKTKRRGK